MIFYIRIAILFYQSTFPFHPSSIAAREEEEGYGVPHGDKELN